MTIGDLKLYNSFTRQKELFIPRKGNQVLWYSCGPTVYDASHMGHARSYVSFDTIRRVMTDYFGYNVQYVMNITDIDDKIIKRARQNHLFDQYVAKDPDEATVLSDLQKAADFLSGSANAEKKLIFQASVESFKSNFNDSTSLSARLENCKDVMLEWLDSEFGAHISDSSIALKHARYWENEFHNDMSQINVKKPDVLTRVSEYIPEIIDYIQNIIDRGFAYVSNGSVYFDVIKFNNEPSHSYATLLKEAFDRDASDGRTVEKKKSPADFTLWKAVKRGEPSWKSPWSLGRPGWHIECSAMAMTICGRHLDIHTGGIDLKFPHHTNEIAQAEAYNNTNDWVKYFLHSGHLTIAGCKMSKSLKNFVTIQDALKKYSFQQIRIAFLMHSWRDTLDYGENTMEHAVQYEKSLNEFFSTVKDTIYTQKHEDSFKKWHQLEFDLNKAFMGTRDEVHNALCDNIDTRKALVLLKELTSSTYLYMKRSDTNVTLIENIASYITNLFKIFGVVSEDKIIGFQQKNDAFKDKEAILRPCLKVLGDFRARVKDLSREFAGNILKVCDEVRDDALPSIGVRLEDKGKGPNYAIKFVDVVGNPPGNLMI